jgi:hypothetical protein
LPPDAVRLALIDKLIGDTLIGLSEPAWMVAIFGIGLKPGQGGFAGAQRICIVRPSFATAAICMPIYLHA